MGFALPIVGAGCGDDTSPPTDEQPSGEQAGDEQAGDEQVPDGRHPVEAWFEELEPWGFRGAVGLIQDGDVQVAAGFGRRDVPPGGEDGDAAGLIDADTRFAIGSITKTLVDIELLMLFDDGRLDPEDRLGDLLPDVPADKANVTLAQLMAHTAGFEHAHGSDLEQIDRTEALERILGQDLRFEPGSTDYYSNSGYTLLAAIVEDVTGRDIEDVLRSDIFEPAGMDNTGFPGDDSLASSPGATGFDDSGNPVPLDRPGPLSWTLQGNGGAMSTVGDMLALDRALCAGEVASDEVIERLGVCGTKGGMGSAGGGDEFSHTALWEKNLDKGITLVVLSAEWEFDAEDAGLAVFDSLLAARPLPDVPDRESADPDATAADLPWTG